MLRYDAHSCTDVTGFGLIGHAREMAVASGVTLEITADALQFLPGAVEYARRGALPGGLKNNREFASCSVELKREIARETEDLLYDPQTAGGLLDQPAGERCREVHRRLSRGPRAGARGQGHPNRMTPKAMHNPIIIALDVESAAAARDMVDQIGPRVNFYKVGLELYTAAGMEVVHRLIGEGKHVFLDLKMYDIPETVSRAVAQAAEVRRAVPYRSRGEQRHACSRDGARRQQSADSRRHGADQLRPGGYGRPGVRWHGRKPRGTARTQGSGNRRGRHRGLAFGSGRGAACCGSADHHRNAGRTFGGCRRGRSETHRHTRASNP
jgi:hypothetical protein